MSAVCLLLVFSSGAFNRAASDDPQAQLVERSAALVINPYNGDPVGTAFCIDSRGYFISTHHVVAHSIDNELILVQELGQSKERRLTARVVRFDETLGLSLLLAEKAAQKALPLGGDEPLVKKMQLTAVGYSFEKSTSMNAAKKEALPAFGASAVVVTSVEHRSDQVHSVEMNARLNPCSAGGPLLDAGGRVVGVLTGEPRDTVRSATSVAAVRTLVRMPVLHADFPEFVPWEDRYKPVRIKASCDMVAADTPAAVPALTLNNGHEEWLVEAKKKGDGYLFRAYLLPKQDPSGVKLRLTLADAVFTCFAQDMSLRGDTRKYLLSELRAYSRKEGLITRDGNTTPFKAEADTLAVFLAEKTIQIPLRSIDAFTVEPKDDATPVRYRLTVEADGVPTASLEGAMRFIRAHEPFEGEIERPLPAPITDVTLAGHGRYMLLRMNSLQQLAVFDTMALEVVKILPLPEPKTLVAGGASSFVLAQPEQHIIQRWSLATLERELVKTLPQSGALNGIGMGYGSEGPLQLHTLSEAKKISFIDLKTFEPIPGLSNVALQDWPGNTLRYRISADGRTVAWYTGDTEAITISETKVVNKRYYNTEGYAVPAPSGPYLYSKKAVLGPGDDTSPTPYSFLTLPSMHPAFYLGVEREPEPSNDPNPIRLSLYASGSSQALLTLPNTPEVRLTGDGEFEGLAIDQLIFFDPHAKLLLTIPTERNRIVARYVGMERHVEEPDPGFSVVSFPAKDAQQDMVYRYQVSAGSRAGKIRYSLETGPEGMEIAEDGLLRWEVPWGVLGRIPVVVRLLNEEGRVVRHSFTIVVAR